MKDLYTKNYKILLKETEDLNNTKTSCVLRQEDLIHLRWQRHPKWTVIYRFNTSPIKIPAASFAEMEKPILRFTWNANSHSKGSQIAKTILKENKVKGFTLPDFWTYSEVTVIESVWYKDRQTYRAMNRIERKTHTHTHTFMVNCFSTRVTRPFNWKRLVSSTNGAGITEYSHARKLSWTPTPHHMSHTQK